MKFEIQRTSFKPLYFKDKFEAKQLDSRNRYTINVKSLNELIELIEEHGEIILSNFYGKNKLEIEVYDDYRE